MLTRQEVIIVYEITYSPAFNVQCSCYTVRVSTAGQLFDRDMAYWLQYLGYSKQVHVK